MANNDGDESGWEDEQKQSSRGVLKKKCSENMQQI